MRCRMADIWNWIRRERGTAAAAGCVALLLAGCSAAPLPGRVPITSATGETGTSAAEPPAPASTANAGADAGTPSGRTLPGAENQQPAAASPDAGGGPDATVSSSSPEPAGTAGTTVPVGATTVTAYFVLLDDGGRHGVRFGCNDSLVGSPQGSAAGDDPLKTAMNTLLRPGQKAGNLYNALGTSRLRFLSGSFDGTTVTVYLAGTLNPGGACDLPRVEAQLTQTALGAAGGVRAAVYINGELLDDYLKQARTDPPGNH